MSIPIYRAEGKLIELATQSRLAFLESSHLLSRIVRNRAGTPMRAYLRADVKDRLPIAEDNYTVRLVSCPGGQYYEWHDRRVEAWSCDGR